MRGTCQQLFRFASVFFCLILAACSGGGGGGGDGGGDGAFSLSATSLSFATTQGGTPGPQHVTVTVNSGLVVIDVFVSGGDAPVSVSFQTTGEATGTITVTPGTANLSPGTYTATITVRGCSTLNCAPGSDVAGSPKTIHVSYVIGASIAVSPGLLSFTHVTGSAYPAAQNLAVVASAGEGWTATVSHPWISIDSGSGTGPGNVSVSVDPTGLAPGTHDGSVTFVVSSSGDTVVASVSLTVSMPAIVAGSGSLWFGGAYGAPLAPQTINLSMNDGAAVAWTATPGAGWILLDKTSGTTPDTLTVSIDPSGLGIGTHTATITVTGSGLGGSTTVDVTVLLVAPALGMTPGNLSFGGVHGGLDSDGKTVQISLGTGTNAYAWSASSSAGWLQVSPSAGSISATPADVTVTIDPTGLDEGIHNGTITFTASVNGLVVNRVLPVDLRLDAHKLLVSDVGVALTSTPTLSKLTTTLKVRSNRGGAINWSAISDQPWLSATSAGVTEGDLVLMANPSGLAVDTLHYANVSITSNDASATNTETVRIGFWVGSTTPGATTMLQGASAMHVADPIRPYVYRYESGGNISVQNIYNSSLIGSITMPSGAQLGEAVITSDGSRLFVPNYANGTIIPVDLPSFSVGTGWANGTPGIASLEYVRSNGIDLLISGNGRFLDPATGAAYSTTFTPVSTSGADRVGASHDGNLFCHQDRSRIPYTLKCRGLYMASDAPGQVLLGAATTGLGPSSPQIIGSDFAVNQKGTRVYVPSRNCCVSGNGEFRVFDSTVSGTMPVIQTLNYSGNPNNAEVDADGRIFLGSESLGTAVDVWVHDSNGSFLTSHEMSGSSGGLLESRLEISGDGLRAITRSDRTLITTVGP